MVIESLGNFETSISNEMSKVVAMLEQCIGIYRRSLGADRFTEWAS